MSKKVNKKIDNIERFLSNFWKIFPNLTSITFNEDVIQPFLQNSLNFCELLSNNILGFYGSPLGSGANGSVGILRINEDDKEEQVYGIILSKKQGEGFEPFYVPIILKNTTNSKQINMNWEIISVPSGGFKDTRLTRIFTVFDPITEIIFGGMLGFLYDCGICPGFSKYFGSYACPTSGKNMYNISILSEKSNITFKDLLQRVSGPDSNPVINPDTLLNLLFQFIYTIYVGKYYLGFSHYDTHLQNVMITYLNNTINIPGQTPIEYIYKGEKINNKKYILFKHPQLINGRECYIAIKNQGLLLKIIDYGACASYLYSSQSQIIRERVGGPSIDFAITKDSKSQHFVSGVAFERGVDFPSVRNTHEIQYLLNNLYEYLSKGMDVIYATNNREQPYNKEYIEQLVNFSGIFFDNDINGINNVKNVISRDPIGSSMHNITTENFKGWYNITRNRDVGLTIPAFNDPNELLTGLIRICRALNHRHHFTDSNRSIYYLENDINPVDINESNSLILDPNRPINNNMYKFIQAEYNYQISCSRGGDEPSCEQIDKWDPNTLLEKPLLSSTNILFNPDGKLDNILLENNLNNYLRQGNDHLKIYSIQINPSGVISSKSDPEDFVYRSYQQWINYKNITDKEGKYMPTVHINISILNPINMNFFITSKYNYDGNTGGLWEISQDKYLNTFNTYFITNGGYFTINTNIQNQIIANNLVNGAALNPMNIFNPIGFYYNKDDIEHSGTTIPVPKPYRNYFAFITKRNNVLAIENYNDFYNQFNHVQIPLLYELEDGTFYATTQNIIQVRNGINNTYGGNPVLKNNSILNPNDKNLEFAFCSGPLLVRDGVVIFDFNTMINKQFAIIDDDVPNNVQPRGVARDKPPNLTSYKIIYGDLAKNNYMFKSGENTDTNQMYGMRHSNRLMVHNVLGIKNNGEIIFIMIEGRGYSAPGLDRVQLANLVQKFDIKDAVSLDGGFSANAVYKIDENRKKYLMEDPDHRPLGISIIFAWV